MHPSFGAAILPFALLVLGPAPAVAQGATVTTWTGTTSSSWGNAANWTAGIPAAGVDAIIGAAPNAPSTAGAAGATCQSLTVQAGGGLTLAAGFDLDVLASVTWAGAAGGTGVLRLAGAGIATGTVPAIRIAGNYTVRAMTVQGDLTQTGGTLMFDGAASANLHVLGNATFQGTTLTGSGTSSVLDVDGNLTFATTGLVTQSTNHPTTIKCAGSWSSNANFRPVAGTVQFDGLSQTVVTNHPSGTCRWANVTVAAGTSVLLPALPLVTFGDLSLAGSLTTSGATVDIAGNLAVGAGAVLGCTAANTLHIGSALSVAGNLQAPAAQLLCDGDFGLTATGVAALGASATHRLSASVASNGVLQAGVGSTFELRGSGSLQSSSGASSLPTTVMTGSYLSRSCTIAGNLTQTAGTVTLDGTQSGILHVLGNAIFQGTTVTGIGTTSTLDVDGNVTLATTSVLDQALNHPTVIRCGGNWTSNANYRPAAGSVIFDGVTPQTVVTNHPSRTSEWADLTIAAGTAVTFAPPLPIHVQGRLTLAASLSLAAPDLQFDGDLTVASGIALTAAAATGLHVGGMLTVRGTIAAPVAKLLCDGACQLDPGGTLQLGAAPHELRGSLSSQGNLAIGLGGTLRLLGSGTFASTAGAASLPSTMVASSYTMLGCTVAGDFTQSAGVLHFDGTNGGTLHVLGNAVFQGTTLTGTGSASTLDVDGNLSFATVGLFDQSSNHPTTITCGGTFTANANFLPAAGTVVLDGSAPQTIVSTSPSGSISWFHLTIASGATVAPPSGQPLAVQGNLSVQGTLTANATSIDVNGDLTVATGASLVATAALTIHILGQLTVQGTLSATRARLLCDRDFLLLAGGTAQIGGGNHQIQRNVTSLGILSAASGATFQLAGPGTMRSLAGTAALPDTVISGTYTTPGATINGSLTQTGGTLTIDATAGPAVLRVLVDATFLGTTVTALGSPTTLDVDRDLRLNTTALVTQLVGPSTIRCGGNWDSNANYQPVGGTVEFDGSGPQTVTAVALTLPDTFIRSANVTFNLQTLNVLRDLTVDAPFTTPTSALTVQNDLVVTSQGQVTVGAGSHVVKHSVTVATGGSTRGPGELIVDGTIAGAAFATTGTGTIENLRVRNGTVTGSAANLTGRLTVESGALVVAGAVGVGGDAEFSGGTLNGTGTLDIRGTATLSGTTATSQLPTIIARGDWVADGSFRPTNGLVRFLPAGIRIIRPLGPGARVVLHEMEVQVSNLQGGSGLELEVRGISISNGGTFSFANLRTIGSAVGTPSIIVSATGRLQLDPGSHWQIAGRTTISIEALGRLSLLGAPGNPCTMSGDNTAPWGLQVAGALEAHDFEMSFGRFTSASDVGLRFLSTISAANIAVRDGSLTADGSTAPTAALVRFDNCPAFDMVGLTFRRTGTPCINAATAASAPRRYRFLNWNGDLGGPNFESDPNNVIDWIGQGDTELDHFRAHPAVGRAVLTVETRREVNSTSLRVERAASPAGPFVPALTITPLTGSESQGANYTVVDPAVVALQRTHYRLLDEVPGRPPRLLAEASVVPWPPQLGTTLFVGPGGFSDPAAAIAVANPGDRVLVAAGSFPAFSLTSAVSVIALEPGTVTIDTSIGPLTVQGLGATAPPIVLAGLRIGSPLSPFGLALNGCQNIVVLDDLVIEASAATTTAIRVDGCTRLAMQQLTAHGQVGLRIATGSIAYLDRGDLTSIQCTADSHLTHAGATIATPTSDPTITALPAIAPRLGLPVALSSDTPQEAAIVGGPGEVWLLLVGTPSFFDPAALLPTGLVLLVDPGSFQVAAQGSCDASGAATFAFNLHNDVQTWGLPVHVQVAGLDLARSPTIMLGNFLSSTLMP